MNETTSTVLDKTSVYESIDAFSNAYQYNASYMKDLYDRSPAAFHRFQAVSQMATYHEELPVEAHYVAAITVMQHEDCGGCLELNYRLAREAGVTEEVLNCLANEPNCLPAKLRDVRQHTLDCLGTGSVDTTTALRIERQFGAAAFAELATTIIGARMFPGMKRALMMMNSCAVRPSNNN